MDNKESQLSQFILINLHMMGLNPQRQNRYSLLLKTIFTASIFFLLVSMVLDIILNWKGIDSVSRMILMPGMFVVICKLLFFIIKQEQIKELLQATEVLWNLNKFGVKVEAKMRDYQNFAYKFIMIYFYTGFITVFLLVLKSLLEDDLLFYSYTLCDIKSSTCYDIYMIFQIILIIFGGVTLTMGFDGFFLHMITECYIGIEMIKIGFQKMFKDPKLFDLDMKEIVMQHNSILEFVKETREMFMNFLLLQFACSLTSQIFCLFMITFNGFPPDIKTLSMYGMPYLVFILQMLLYCSAGNLIMDQTLSLGDAAYGVQWYKKHHIKLRKPLATIILRSQRAETISIGNIAPLNLETYLNIIRNSVSLCGLLQTFSSSNSNEEI